MSLTLGDTDATVIYISKYTMNVKYFTSALCSSYEAYK